MFKLAAIFCVSARSYFLCFKMFVRIVLYVLAGVAIAQSVGSWLGDLIVADSSPTWTIKV